MDAAAKIEQAKTLQTAPKSQHPIVWLRGHMITQRGLIEKKDDKKPKLMRFDNNVKDKDFHKEIEYANPEVATELFTVVPDFVHACSNPDSNTQQVIDINEHHVKKIVGYVIDANSYNDIEKTIAFLTNLMLVLNERSSSSKIKSGSNDEFHTFAEQLIEDGYNSFEVAVKFRMRGILFTMFKDPECCNAMFDEASAILEKCDPFSRKHVYLAFREILRSKLRMEDASQNLFNEKLQSLLEKQNEKDMYVLSAAVRMLPYFHPVEKWPSMEEGIFSCLTAPKRNPLIKIAFFLEWFECPYDSMRAEYAISNIEKVYATHQSGREDKLTKIYKKTKEKWEQEKEGKTEEENNGASKDLAKGEESIEQMVVKGWKSLEAGEFSEFTRELLVKFSQGNYYTGIKILSVIGSLFSYATRQRKYEYKLTIKYDEGIKDIIHLIDTDEHIERFWTNIKLRVSWDPPNMTELFKQQERMSVLGTTDKTSSESGTSDQVTVSSDSKANDSDDLKE